MKQVEKLIFFCHLIVVSILFKTTEAFSVHASLSFFYFDTTSNKSVSEHCMCGLYGLNSPLLSAQGQVGIPVSDNLEACDANTRFSVTKPPWIALIERGNCSFAEKIKVATRRGAAAAVIYNKLGKGNSTVLMSHPGEYCSVKR